MPMKPKLILPAQDKLAIYQERYGVEIQQVDLMTENSAIFISYERLEKVIACLHQIHMKRQPKEWKE